MRRLGSPLRLLYAVSLLVAVFSTSAAAQNPLTVQNVNFGSVQVGSSLIMPAAVTNTGKSKIKITKVSISGTAFVFVGPNLPINLNSQQAANLSVSFAPNTAGSFSGSITVTYWAASGGHGYGARATASLSGTGSSSATGYLTAPSSMNLGSVPVGSSQTQALTLSNTGKASLTISATNVAGSGYSVSGLSLPYSLASGASANVSVTFSPAASGTDSATLTLTSNASDPTVTVSLTGSGTTSNGTLGVTPGSMSFGNVTIGTTQTQNGSVTASGGSVTLSSTSSSNSAFILAGLTLPVTLSAGQSLPFTVTFAPTASGTASANISFFANSNSATETASGSGATVQHIIDLSWNASTSGSIAGYNVYRANASSGPYSKINAALDPALSYSDSTVSSGKTYYYETTAVDSAGVESSYSNQVQVVVPFP